MEQTRSHFEIEIDACAISPQTRLQNDEAFCLVVTGNASSVPRSARPSMLMKPALWISLLLSAQLGAAPVFIGTSGGQPGEAHGIYRADFDPSTGTLGKPVLAVASKAPGFLVQHPHSPVLLAIGSPQQPFADGSSAVIAFAIGEDHSLRMLGEASTGGRGACHLAIDASGRTVAVANYADGIISTLRLDERGVPRETISVITNRGSGPHPQRQKGPHAHGVYFDQANRHLYVPDLGLDKVLVYPFDAATSRLGDAMAPLVTAPGAGPRHLAFSADESHAYVINELDNTVLVARHDQGRLSALRTIATLPAGFSGANTTAEIELSPDGRFLYASNRGHDSIVVLHREPADGIEPVIQHAPCGGRTPRHFKISPCGKWLLCGHQGSHSVSVLPRDPASGRLGQPVSTVSVPTPTCILFARD